MRNLNHRVRLLPHTYWLLSRWNLSHTPAKGSCHGNIFIAVCGPEQGGMKKRRFGLGLTFREWTLGIERDPDSLG